MKKNFIIKNKNIDLIEFEYEKEKMKKLGIFLNLN